MDVTGDLAAALKHHEEILFAYLYGSVARGEEHTGSDVDIGVFVRDGFSLPTFYEANLAGEIEEAADVKNVEVTVLNDRQPRFLNQVLRYGVLLFSRDEQARVSFEERVTKTYIDLKPRYEAYDRGRPVP